MSDQNPEPQSKSPKKIKPPPECVGPLSTLEPAEVIVLLESVIFEYELEFESLTDNMKGCEEIIKTKAQRVNELQKCHQEISELEESSSNLKFRIYQERGNNCSLSAEKDKLEIEIVRAKNEIESLLKQCGDEKTQKTVDLTCESQKPLFVLKKDSPESRDQKEEKDMRQNANRDPPELLEWRIKSLTDQLQNTTKHQDDYVQALIKYKDGYRQQYKSGQERFDRKMTSLARRIKITEEEIICFMDELTTIRKESKQKEIIWIQEKSKLVQELESCKKRSGKGKKVHSANPWVLHKLQDKVDTLENQLIRHDKLMAAYKTQCKELKVEFGSVKHQLDVSHDEAKEKESKMAAEIKHYKSRIKDLEEISCLEKERYQDDIKRLNERLKSLEKQDVKKKVPHFK